MKKKNICCHFGLLLLFTSSCHFTMTKSTTVTKSTFQTDTFRNPILFADVPDPSVIRVGSDFYMVSTTMHMMPGAPIMKSKDLVNWEIISYVYDSLKDSPKYDLENGSVYGRGQWATSLRYHNDKYYVFFATNDPGKSYIYTATDPAGPWQLHADIDRLFHDASLLFDDDGKVYLAHGSGNIRITQLKSDLTGIEPNGLDVIAFSQDEEDNALLEGAHFAKYNGKYYIFSISWPRGAARRQLSYRADNITGPYEKKVILDHAFNNRGGVAQGTVIDTEKGEWYGFLFQDHGAVGRVPILVPCRWEDGWPILGDADGKVQVVNQKLIEQGKTNSLVKSDDFNNETLDFCWQWNHNPDNALWSLTERPGYMRLKTGKVTNTIFSARNTLTQRTEGEKNSGSVALDISNMKNGDIAGFGVFAEESGLLSIKMKDDKKILVMSETKMLLSDVRQRIISGEEAHIKGNPVIITSDVIYLRIDCDFSLHADKATFYYSTDNETWTPIGSEFKMRYALTHFMGYRYAIFNYATETSGGHVDIDFFHHKQ
jgi:Beta-xylosidase